MFMVFAAVTQHHNTIHTAHYNLYCQLRPQNVMLQPLTSDMFKKKAMSRH
jgi:hypothetical protein